MNSNPNMRAVNRVVEANLEFQSRQTDYQHDLNVKQTNSEGPKEEEFGGFYMPQHKPEEHRNSLSPRRLPSFKKKSSYANRKQNVIPYMPKNRPVTPNANIKGFGNLMEDSQEPDVKYDR